MEKLSHEASPSGSPEEAYEYNHYNQLMELSGRIVAGLSANYRTERPRTWEHVGKQEELIAMLQSLADFVEAKTLAT